MAEITMSSTEIEDMFREVVCLILGLDPESNHKRIRFPWGSEIDTLKGISSTPDWKRDENVCFIYSRPNDDAYNRQRDTRYVHREGRNLVAIDEHTDVHDILFVNYGPDAYDCARKIRNGLFLDEIRRLLKRNNFHLLVNVPAPRRVPELVNAEWWNRVDVNAMFNQFVRLESNMTTIERVRFTTSFPNNSDSGMMEDYTEVSRRRNPKPRKEG